MTDPFDDSSWSDLAAELGVETPKIARKVEAIPEPIPEAPPPVEAIEEPAPANLSDTLFAEPPAPVEAEAEEAGGESEVIELGGTDEQKKRRRRRRRGKKRDGEPGDAEANAAEDAPEPPSENLSQPSELLRDLIKNWDVPSWDEIVGGLYRPNR